MDTVVEKKTEGQCIAEARDEYFKSKEGERILEGSSSGKYLMNRLELAFIAGWDAGAAYNRNNDRDLNNI